MKNIVIIDHFSQTPDEPGNNRFTYLAKLLVNQGYKVKIITTDFSHKNKKKRDTQQLIIDKLPYAYEMLPEPGYKKNVCISRFVSHYIFGKNLSKYLDTIEKPDVVYISVPSLDVGRAAVRYCGKNNIPLIVDIQDLWPEAFQLVFNIPVIKDVIFYPLKRTADKIYKNADKLIAVSDTYLARGMSVNKKDKNGSCVFLGTDLNRFDKFKTSYDLQKGSEFWVGYAGTLGHSYNITIVLNALKKLNDKGYSNIIFKILGDGPLMDEFKHKAKELGIQADFMGRLDYSKMVSVLYKCDIAVNPISKGAAQSIINKHGDYAAAGLPVVSTQECPEYRKLISDYKCGFNCECENTDEVADAIETLYNDLRLREEMGRNSRRLAEDKFDRSKTYKEIIDTIESLANR